MLCVCASQAFFLFKTLLVILLLQHPIESLSCCCVYKSVDDFSGTATTQTKKDHLRRATHNDSPGLYDDDDDDDESLFISSFALQMESQKGLQSYPQKQQQEIIIRRTTRTSFIFNK